MYCIPQIYSSLQALTTVTSRIWVYRKSRDV